MTQSTNLKLPVFFQSMNQYFNEALKCKTLGALNIVYRSQPSVQKLSVFNHVGTRVHTDVRFTCQNSQQAVRVIGFAQFGLHLAIVVNNYNT